jgi:uncharacterized protein (TIGR02246 family)
MVDDRPRFADRGLSAADGRETAERLLADLQIGWDEHDADVTDRHFADDIVWGSPFGATVQGFEPLHAIHAELKARGRGGPSSRFEIVYVLAPTPDVVLAQIRRTALGPDGEPIAPTNDVSGPFSEMALYVLVRRDHQWWVAAGQNTPIRAA